MHSILLFDPDEQPLDAPAIERIMRSEPGFRDVQVDTAVDMIQASYEDFEYRTTVYLNRDQTTISLRSTTDTSLRAAMILQRRLGIPLRMVDTDYTFDLILEGISDLEELHAAIERFQTG